MTAITTMPAPASYQLHVGDLNSVPVSVVRAPHLSVLRWLTATSTRPQSPLAAAIAQSASRDGSLFLASLGMPGLDRVPDVLTHVDAHGPTSVEANAVRLRDSDGAVLAGQIEQLWHGRPPGPWRAASVSPRRWLRSAAGASVQAWSVLSKHWHAAELLLRMEEARIGTAAVTGTLAAVIENISPRLHVRGEYIAFDAACGSTTSLAGRRLVFVPMLAPGRQVVVSFESGRDAYIAYPLPGTRPTMRSSRGHDDAAADTDRLTALLGPIRAAALRSLHSPQSMGALAREVHCAPSTLTYHCDQLVAAGLLERERRGQSIWVSRTDRAVRLLSALE
jgi:DNA-binding transcriptional ArsR family regulator